LAFAFSSRASAEGPGRFEQLKEKASSAGSLGAFLNGFVGSCKGDRFEQRDCERRLASARKEKRGKLVYLRLPERHASLIRLLRALPDGSLTLGLTPFFDADGYGLSRNKAPKFDRKGNPRAALLSFQVRLPESVSQRNFELLLRSRNLRLELLLRPTKAWKVKRRGEEAAQGVAAKFVGLRLSSARSGEPLGEMIWGS